MGQIKKIVQEGEIIPKFYGMAYWDYMRRIGICYPLGINWIVWLCREIYFRVMVVPLGKQGEMYRQGFKDGEQSGYRLGLRAGYKEAFDKLEKQIDADYNRMRHD